MVSFLSAQSWYKIFVNKLLLEFSFPSIDSIKTNFGFFLPTWGCYYTRNLCLWQLSTKLTNLPFPCWRNIHRLDCLCCSGINAVKDSQMKPETPNASDASPHSWSKMQIETLWGRQKLLRREDTRTPKKLALLTQKLVRSLVRLTFGKSKYICAGNLFISLNCVGTGKCFVRHFIWKQTCQNSLSLSFPNAFRRRQCVAERLRVLDL